MFSNYFCWVLSTFLTIFIINSLKQFMEYFALNSGNKGLIRFVAQTPGFEFMFGRTSKCLTINSFVLND